MKREMLADKLTWFANRIALDISDDRRHHRVVPFLQRAIMRLPDGRERIVKILDFSTSGVAVETMFQPEVGTEITIGKTQLTVLRHFDGGFAGEFVTPFAPGDIHEATVL